MILMLIFIFLVSTYSKSISLSNGNYELLKDSKSKHLLIQLWDSKSQSIYQNLESSLNNILNKELSKEITLADINCQENENLCSSLTKNKKFPQLIWVDSDTKQKFLYKKDNYEIENLKDFIQTQLSFPFIYLNDDKKVSKIKNENRNCTTFILYYKSKQDEKVKNAQIAAKKLIQNEYFQFYAVESKKFKLRAIRVKNSESSYQGGWSVDSIEYFIKCRTFPTLIELNRNSMTQLKKFHRLSLVTFLDPEIYLSDWKHLAQEIESEFQFSYVIYSPRNQFVRMAGIKASNLPTVILFDSENQNFIVYENDLTDTGLIKWMKQLNLQNAEWQKPRNLFISRVVFDVVSLLTNGGPLFYVFLLLLICFVALVIKLANDYFKRRPKNKKGSDIAYQIL